MDFVKMVEDFTNVLKYCSLTIEFVQSDAIHLFHCEKGFCLFDLTTDKEHFYQTSSELVANAKKYLDILTVSGVGVNGNNMPGTEIYRLKE